LTGSGRQRAAATAASGSGGSGRQRAAEGGSGRQRAARTTRKVALRRCRRRFSLKRLKNRRHSHTERELSELPKSHRRSCNSFVVVVVIVVVVAVGSSLTQSVMERKVATTLATQ